VRISQYFYYILLKLFCQLKCLTRVLHCATLVFGLCSVYPPKHGRNMQRHTDMETTMNRIKLSILVLVIMATSITVTQAQTTTRNPLTATNCIGTVYKVQHGDVLDTMFGPNWTRLLESNKDLGGRISIGREGNKTIAWIYEGRGDELCIPPGMKTSEVIHKATSTVTAPVATTIDEKKGEAKISAVLPFWSVSNPMFWILLVVLAIVLVVGLLYLRNRIADWHDARMAREHEAERTAAHEAELTQNPVTSGPAYVPGGIPTTEPQRLHNFFEQQAIARYAERNPNVDRNSIRVEQLGPVECGTIAGEGEVGYLGGQWRPRRIQEPGIDAYQARFRYQDNTEEIIQCIEHCMNPVRLGGQVMRGFTFTARRAAVPIPEPVAPAPQAVPHPAVAVARIRAAADEEGQSTIKVGDRMMTVERGAHFEVANGKVMITGGGFKMIVEENDPAASLSKTGTSGS
jgi:hypothetical protein